MCCTLSLEIPTVSERNCWDTRLFSWIISLISCWLCSSVAVTGRPDRTPSWKSARPGSESEERLVPIVLQYWYQQRNRDRKQQLNADEYQLGERSLLSRTRSQLAAYNALIRCRHLIPYWTNWQAFNAVLSCEGCSEKSSLSNRFLSIDFSKECSQHVLSETAFVQLLFCDNRCLGGITFQHALVLPTIQRQKPLTNWLTSRYRAEDRKCFGTGNHDTALMR